MASVGVSRGAGGRARAVSDARSTTETRPATKTTEFYAYVIVMAGVLLAGLVTKGGAGSDTLIARQVWLYAAILTAGYMLSRGLAKAGTWEPSRDDEDRAPRPRADEPDRRP
jgi:hypothetical protein